MWFTITAAVVTGVLTVVCLGWGLALLSGWGGQPFAVSLGGIGLTMAALGVAAKFLDVLSEFVPRLVFVSGFPVRVCSDIDRGEGIRLSHPTRVLPLTGILLGLSMYGQSCWWARRAGHGNAVLPWSTGWWATGALALSIVSFVLLVLVWVAARRRIFYELYPSGIVRRNPLPGPRARDRFVPWDDIAGVESKSQYVSFYLPSAPMIVARLTDSAAAVDNRLFDKVGELGIPAYLVRCDANVLLTIIEYLVHDPMVRRLVADKGAPHWFTTQHHANTAAGEVMSGDLVDLVSRRLGMRRLRQRAGVRTQEQQRLYLLDPNE